MLRVGWDGSSFRNNVESVTWDNPLRFGPDLAGTASQGRMALWPSNTLTYVHGTGAVSLPGRTRLTPQTQPAHTQPCRLRIRPSDQTGHVRELREVTILVRHRRLDLCRSHAPTA